MKRVLPALLGLALLIAPALSASETASVISVSAGGASLWHLGITAAVPNPVTGVTSGIYGCISFGAGLFDLIVDPPPEAAPKIAKIVYGQATDRDRKSGELVSDGDTAPDATTCRMVSLIGTEFSWVADEMKISFDGAQAPISPLSTNTLVTTMVPQLKGPFPRDIDVVIEVKGQESKPHRLTLVGTPAIDSESSKRVLAKLRKLTTMIRDYPWDAQRIFEKPDLAGEQLGKANEGAEQMVSCSEEALPALDEFATLLADDAAFRSASDCVLSASPELERDIDAGIEVLRESREVLRRNNAL